MTHLQVGDLAPEFSGLDQHGIEISMDDFVGKRIVLYFYPKDDTPGCTAEACSFRDGYQDLLDAGFAVVGVSPDPVKKHAKFVEKYDLPFSLIADEDRKSLMPMVFGAARNSWAANTMGSTAKPLSSARMAESSESSTRWTPRTAPAKF